MLSVTGLNKFYYIKNFTDMRCSKLPFYRKGVNA